jgi:hypothetical protein
MIDATIVYYTSNGEKPEFEAKIVENLKQVSNGLPIISVSQKPMDLGTNICVGEVGKCYANGFRQLIIGVEAAKTEWIIVAESDCLYPPLYFNHPPKPVAECYGGTGLHRYSSVWILWTSDCYRAGSKRTTGYYRKAFTEGAQMCPRDNYLYRLNWAMRRRPMWQDPSDPWRPTWKLPYFPRKRKWEWYGSEDQPMVSFKTGHGVQPNTGTRGDVAPVDVLPYWGPANDLRKRME